MKKMIAIIFVGLLLAGCQPPAQPTANPNAERQEAARRLFAQSIVLLQNKDLKGAVTSLEQSIQVDPSDPNPYLLLGQILLKANEFARATEFLDQTAKTFPSNGTVFYMLAIANRMDGKKLPAVLSARRSYEIFNAAGDAQNAQASAVMLQELITEAQTEEAAATTGAKPTSGAAAPKK